MSLRTRRCRPLYDAEGRPIDVEIDRPGATPLRLLGPGGPRRELAILNALHRPDALNAADAPPARPVLPVLLGAGMGHALARLLEAAPTLPGAGDCPAGVPLVAVVGDIGDNIEAAYDMGVSAVFSINRVAVPFREAKPRSKSDLALTMDNLMRFCRRMGW